MDSEELVTRWVKIFDKMPLHVQDAQINDIIEAADLCSKSFISKLCYKCNNFKLKKAVHVLLLNLIRRSSEEPGPKAKSVIVDVMEHPQEMIDFLTMYMRNGKQPSSKQMSRGLQLCFSKFTEAQFKQCSNKGPWKLRDVMYICRPKPMDEERARLYTAIAKNRL
jgi:hypothetical protein